MLRRTRISRGHLLPRSEGLHGAFGFPVLLRGEVFGVMEFFSREIREPDEHLLPMLTTVGNQLGMFIDRQRAQEELAIVHAVARHALYRGIRRIFEAGQSCVAKRARLHRNRAAVAAVYGIRTSGRPRGDACANKEAVEGKPVVSIRESVLPQGRDGALDAVGSPRLQDQQMVYAAARDITERKAGEELRARNTNLELLDEKLAALTETRNERRVRARLGYCPERLAARRARVAGVLAGPRAMRFHVTKAPDGAKIPEVDGNSGALSRSELGVTASSMISADPNAQRNRCGTTRIPICAACPHSSRGARRWGWVLLVGAISVQVGRHSGCASHRRSAGRDSGERRDSKRRSGRTKRQRVHPGSKRACAR